MKVFAALNRFRGKEWLAEHAAVIAFFTITTAMMIGNVVLRGDVTADVGFDDRLFDTRLMRYEFDWLMGRTQFGLFDIDFFYPHRNALATTDPEFGLILVTLPVRLFTDDYLLLTNLAAFLSFILAGHAMYLLAKQLSNSRGAALFAAVAFSFCQYRFHQIDHSQILQMQWLLYALYCIHRLARAPGWKWAVPLAFFVWLHGIASLSAAILSLPLIPLIALWSACTAEVGKRLRVLLWAAGAGAIAGFAMFPFYRPLLINREVYAIVRDLGEVRMYSGRVEQLWATPAYNKLYGAERAADMGRESLTFPGYVLLFFGALGAGMPWNRLSATSTLRTVSGAISFGLDAIIALARAAAFAGMVYAAIRWSQLWLLFAAAIVAFVVQRRRSKAPAADNAARTFWVYGSLGVMFLLFAFGPEIVFRGQQVGGGLWEYVTKFPGYAQVRTPSRFYWVTMVCLALLGAAGVKLVLAQVPFVIVRRAAVLLLVGLALTEMWVEIPPRQMRTLAQAPAVYSWLRDQPGRGPVAEVPYFNEGPERYRMYFANIHKHPTVNAESSFVLPSLNWIRAQALLSPEGPINVERLRVAGLEYFIIHTREMPQNLTDAHRALFSSAGAVMVHSVEGDEVWQFKNRPQVAPFAPANLSTRIQIPNSVAAGAPFLGHVVITANAVPVFEQTHRKLKLELDGLPLEGQSRFKVHVAPPLFLPARPVSFPISMIAGKHAGRYAVQAKLMDEDGQTWATFDGNVDIR